jgi:ABC-type enterobactin transport system permease subunit
MTSTQRTEHQRISYIDRLGTRFFATSTQLERGAVTFRLIAAVPLALVMFSSRERLPYWEYAIGAIGIMFAVNVWLNLANKNQRISPNRSALIGSAVDTLLLLLVSNLAIRASADINSTSEMWLVFPLVILTFVYRAKPITGIVYSVLLTAWYSAHILAFFDPADRAVTELPIRATFFVLMGGLAAILGNSLRQHGSNDS